MSMRTKNKDKELNHRLIPIEKMPAWNFFS